MRALAICALIVCAWTFACGIVFWLANHEPRGRVTSRGKR